MAEAIVPEGFILDQQSPPEGFIIDVPSEEGQARPTSGNDTVNDTPSSPDNSGPVEIGEPGLTLLTGAVAEPIAGIAGIAQSLNPFAEEGAGARAVESTREALTFQPRSESGKESLQAVGEFIEPVAEGLKGAEDFLGDNTFEATGSAALAAAAKSIPTALIEILGLAAGKGLVRSANKTKRAAAQGQIAKSIDDAAPSIDQLKDTARAVYKEIDELGVSLKPRTYQSLVKKLDETARGMGLDPDITPKAQKALDRFADRLGDSPSLGDVDIMRKIAQNAADTLEGSDRAIGTAMVGVVDDFLDNVSEARLRKPPDLKADVGKRYKVARDLWGRARRSELLEDAFEKARNQASGFENGIRTQFRQILNNKRKTKFFKPDELNAIRRVVRGTGKENIARLIGKLGFSEGSSTQLIGGSLGVGAGAFVGGPIGAVAVPLVGQVSKKLAQRMTIKNAEFANQVIRAGKDAKKIAASYIRNTKRSERTAQELSELLMRSDINLDDLPKGALFEEAARITAENRAGLAGSLAPTALREDNAKSN